MAGCTSRCRQGVLKLIQSLRRLVSGTLTKGTFKCVLIPVCCQKSPLHFYIHHIYNRLTWISPPYSDVFLHIQHTFLSGFIVLFHLHAAKTETVHKGNDVVITVYKQRRAAVFSLLLILYQLCNYLSTFHLPRLKLDVMQFSCC